MFTKKQFDDKYKNLITQDLIECFPLLKKYINFNLNYYLSGKNEDNRLANISLTYYSKTLSYSNYTYPHNISAFNFYLSDYPSGEGCVVLSNVNVNIRLQKMGVGKWLMKWQIRLMKDMGYDFVIATSTKSQKYVTTLYNHYNWHRCEPMCFWNKRSGNSINFWKLNLNCY
jgi:hypothetical protein